EIEWITQLANPTVGSNALRCSKEKRERGGKGEKGQPQLRRIVSCHSVDEQDSPVAPHRPRGEGSEPHRDRDPGSARTGHPFDARVKIVRKAPEQEETECAGEEIVSPDLRREAKPKDQAPSHPEAYGQ